jgi:DnaJ-class molecular chaperone
MPRRPSPFDAFFDSIIDTVLDRVEDAITPKLEDLSSHIAQTVNRQVKSTAKRMHTNYPHKRSRADRPPRPPFDPPPPRPTPSRPQEPTLYDVLEVSPRASQETITAAYRALSRVYHPDLNPTGGTGKMKELNAAYEVLKDKEKRKAYDRHTKIR